MLMCRYDDARKTACMQNQNTSNVYAVYRSHEFIGTSAYWHIGTLTTLHKRCGILFESSYYFKQIAVDN